MKSIGLKYLRTSNNRIHSILMYSFNDISMLSFYVTEINYQKIKKGEGASDSA